MAIAPSQLGLTGAVVGKAAEKALKGTKKKVIRKPPRSKKKVNKKKVGSKPQGRTRTNY